MARSKSSSNAVVLVYLERDETLGTSVRVPGISWRSVNKLMSWIVFARALVGTHDFWCTSIRRSSSPLHATQ